jgi:hypothetical protein
MDGADEVEDPIAAVVIGGSTYERLRLRRPTLFDQPIARKLTWQAAILGVLALVLPLAATLPASSQALFPGGDPLAAAPRVLLLGVYAGGVELLAAGVLCYVSYRRRRDELTNREAHRLLTVEELSSLIGIATPAVAVAAINAVFLLGHRDTDAMATLLEAGGSNPLVGTVVPASVSEVALSAAVLAVFLFALSRILQRRLVD